jgi:hypothetical protein
LVLNKCLILSTRMKTMSDVKSRVIRIVQGLPPEEPKVLVELKPHQEVVSKHIHISTSDEVLIQRVHSSKLPAAPDPSGDNRELDRPLVSFKMLEADHAYIQPRHGFWPYPLPRIVLT